MFSKAATRSLGMGDVATSPGEGAVERMARYKEERRRQLASQFGARPSDASAPRRYITRGNSSAAADIPKVRTTRTSRLRAGNASSDTSPNTDSNPQDGAGPRTRRSGAPATRRPITTSSSSSIAAAVDEKPSTMSDSGTRREKDKSAKRKSNLNRCLTAEAVAADVSTDDSSVRRRRRPVTGLSTTPVNTQTSPTTVSESSLSPRKSTASVSLRNYTPATPKKTVSPSVSSPQHAGRYPLKRASVSSTGSPKNVPLAPSLSAEQQKSSLNSLASKAKLSEVRLCPRNVDNKTIDVCQRVEILTALTKESLARLDKLTGPSAIEECGSVNHDDAQQEPPSDIQSLISKDSDDISGKICSIPKRSPISVNEDSLNSTDTVPAENEELNTSPTRPTSSILKKKVSDCKQNISSPVPVSILKRKTSQDEAGSNSSCSAHATPVTFSPTVKENSNSNSRRQGILKKRASLDESEVMRRRSCSPDMNHSLTRANCEFRPILKNQRRSSMEELVRRTQSPDPQPHSILKRKASRDDESEERINASPEPQGILKRKSNVSSSSSSNSGSPHISISQSVIISSIPSMEFAVEGSDLVRPILKKKSSSEETNTGDSSLTDTPRPILKKKTSIDVEESDDRPKKPILKSKKHSQDGSGPLSLDSSSQESPTRCLKLRSLSVGDSGAMSDGESVKPILKYATNNDRASSPHPRLSFCNDEDAEENSLEHDDSAETYANRWNGKLLSPSSGEGEFSNSSNRRRLWDGSFSSLEVSNDVLSISVETENSDPVKTLSVAERVLTMENYIDQSRSESVSPTNRTGAVPKRLSSSRYMRDKDRFHTQPITQEELDASNKLKSVQDFQSYLNVKQLNNVSKVDNDESVTESLESREFSNELLSLSPSLKSDCSLLQDSETKLNNQETMELGLNKSSSVSAMASLFAQKQEEALQEANKNILQKSKGSPGVRKYRERRKEWANQARVSTQPITQEEVEEAVRLNKQQSESREENNDVDDDDPSKLSLGERIRLFNQKIVEEQPKPKESPPPATAKRPARFRTQPVTTEEVETAQKKISNLAASFAKPPDTESLEGLSVHALREKMYEHGASILSKTTTSSHLVSAPSSRESSPVKIMDSDARPKGILKHPEHPRAELATSEDITETESEAEVKGILKVPSSSGIAIPELESFRHLKSVLKKETSTEEHSVGDVSSEVVSTTNDQLLRSILKPESTGWIADKNSTSSEDSSDSEGDKIQQSSRGRNSMDLVKMLHGVEAHAKQQRQANRLTDEQKLKNIKNLSQEKENHAFPVKTIGENDIIPTKKGNQHVLHSKIVEQKYLDQKLSPSKLLSLEKDLLIKQQQMNIKKIASQLQESEIQSFSSDNVTPQTSDGETSSGGREVKHIIRNEAVARRRQAAINRLNRSNPSLQQQQQLWKSRSQTSVPQATAASASASELTAPLAGVALQRSLTQPMPITTEDMSGASIADRLAALQKSGNNDWRKRISQMNPLDDLSILTTKNQLNELHIKQSSYREISRSTEVKEERKNGTEEPDRVGILADRLGMLDAATQGWKKRVGPTDAVNFSVAGRMMQQQHKITTTTTIYSSPESLNVPLPPQLQYGATPDKQKRTPRAMRFRSKRALLKDIASTPTSPQKENVSSPTFKRSLSAPGGDDENSLVSVDDEESLGPKVVIPRTDDETFSEFFRSVTTENVKNDHLEILDEDLDTIINSSSQLLVQKKTVKVQRRNVTTRNPIKALAARTDLKENYVEVKTGIAEKEIKRLNVEKLAKNSSLAVEALAGLASKEDFTAVALKKASGSVGAMLPYKDLMLLHIKGRRHVQTRLVEPVAASINRGDNYVLVTPTEVFNWVGHYSNVIERSRGAEVAQHIAQKKDLGYKGSGQVATINEDKITCSTSLKEKFWSLLGCEKGSESAKPSEAGHPDEDELYESCLIATNKVYEMKDSELVPIEEYWGSIPRIQMLDPAKILVFDLGSEMYIWNGKNASLEDRRQAQQLSRELWAEGYDYSGCDICPLDIASVLGCRNSYESSATTSSVRPSWALLAKVTQHMETVLFREKFLDWPDFSRVIRSKSTEDMAKQVDPSIDIKPCDVSEMLSVKMHDPDLELEGTHLGRGKNYYDEEMRRYYEISTLGVTMWHIQEYEHTELPKSSVGQFHSGDSYVVRWQYSITVTGRELNGQPSRHSVAGRDRCAYFCWQGKDASLNEQGAAALLTVELDHERGPQVRVVQGYEPPAFLNLFSGGMVVHSNKRNDDVTGPWRLFLCRGDVESEAVLVEVPCSTRQLRNRACFILVNIQTGSLFIWHGGKAPKHTRKVVKVAAENIKNKRPPEIGFSSSAKIDIYEQEEGSEKREFFQGLGGSKRQLYVSQSLTDTPRLFHLSSLSGSFCATEILGPYRNPEVTTAFPFLQEDLYNANQPGLFLLDSGRDLWLWQGWWPDSTDDPANQTGSGAVRWQAERRAAMQTALDYAKSARKGKVSALLVWAGLEPLDFTNLFPMWTDRDDIAELNIRDGKKPGEVLTVENELARLTRSTYPPAQLLQRPLPDGVDPTCLEVYLNPQHFQELLGMTKDEFSALPTWKQTKLKKDVGLF